MQIQQSNNNYLRAPFIVIFAWAMAAACAPAALGQLTIVSNGAPRATIVVAATALKPDAADVSAGKVHIAAVDLQTYIERISGARLPISADSEQVLGNVICVGPGARTSAFHVDIPHGITVLRKEEGFVIACKAGGLLLAGNDAGPYHGTEYATYTLLYDLGVRWFMPGPYGEVVPTRKTITIPFESKRQRPDFIMRNWWVHTTPEMLELERRWKIRNLMNPDDLFAAPGDGSLRGFVADSKLAAAQPDLFARNPDGTTNPYMPNLSSSAAAQIAADRMITTFKAHPDESSIGISPDDGLPRDFSPATMAENLNLTELGGRYDEPTEVSTSEEWFTFINRVAKAVNRAVPNRIVMTNGYANRDLPPDGVEIDPHVGVMFAAIWSDTLHSYDDPKSWMMERQGQILKRWAQMCPLTWVYGYDYSMLVTALTPVPLPHKVARDLALMKKWGVIGFLDEANNIWAESGIATKYVRARLSWDTHTNVDQLLTDFYRQWYGSAAVAAQYFWETIEKAIRESPMLGHEDRILPFIYTRPLLARLDQYLTAAEHMAAMPRERDHVRADRLIYEHLLAYVQMNEAEYAGRFGLAADKADLMMAIRRKLHALNSFWIMPTEQGYEAGAYYWGVTQRAAYYRRLAGLVNGRDGTLVSMLPEQAKFHLDPQDEGRFAGWSMRDWDGSRWRLIRTTMPFYAQGYMSSTGYPYTGPIWYRFGVTVPASAKGHKVYLLAPVVETEAWVWVNGKFCGHRPYREAYIRPNEMNIDISSAVQPGRSNTIAIRVETSLNPGATPGGLCSRLFLYSPIPK